MLLINQNLSSGSSSSPKIKYWDGATWIIAPIKYWDGVAWQISGIAKYWNGSSWVAV